MENIRILKKFGNGVFKTSQMQIEPYNSKNSKLAWNYELISYKTYKGTIGVFDNLYVKLV